MIAMIVRFVLVPPFKATKCGNKGISLHILLHPGIICNRNIQIFIYVCMVTYYPAMYGRGCGRAGDLEATCADVPAPFCSPHFFGPKKSAKVLWRPKTQTVGHPITLYNFHCSPIPSSGWVPASWPVKRAVNAPSWQPVSVPPLHATDSRIGPSSKDATVGFTQWDFQRVRQSERKDGSNEALGSPMFGRADEQIFYRRRNLSRVFTNLALPG